MMKIFKTIWAMVLVAISLQITAAQNPPIQQEAEHYGDIDVSRPDIQVPRSVKPLFDTWLRDTYATLGPDGYYYLTGTYKMPDRPTAFDDSPGIPLWRSTDLKEWEYRGLVLDLYTTDFWQKDHYFDQKRKKKVDLNGNPVKQKRRTAWAPEIHYLKSQKNYFVVACTPENPNGRGTYILRSTSGKPEGPYENIEANKEGPMFNNIDGSLFEDEDGTVYFVGHNHYIAKMKPDMSGLAEKLKRIEQSKYKAEPYIEGAFMLKAFGKYHLIQAIWSLKLPDGSFMYRNKHKAESFKDGKKQRVKQYSYDLVIATSDSPYGPFGRRYTSAIGAGHNNLFKDKEGRWWATMFGNPKGTLDRPFIARPAIIPMRVVESKFYPDHEYKLK
ncbi:family 43 glycosylhydrolase [Echinimonas agarilytica]|uniref:Family 43 glycosylhydrolase n=1 Tax=Echinimonas agarilytica TaxID=1215918 RepID=A0AA41W6E0_9GAMM|nr:family 43 glycosylhydrolase [Echinimonas agarilytica]MCM2679378.1 family 43 glycosylhydrolase [Echinimonas agarilytica]